MTTWQVLCLLFYLKFHANLDARLRDRQLRGSQLQLGLAWPIKRGINTDPYLDDDGNDDEDIAIEFESPISGISFRFVTPGESLAFLSWIISPVHLHAAMDYIARIRLSPRPTRFESLHPDRETLSRFYVNSRYILVKEERSSPSDKREDSFSLLAHLFSLFPHLAIEPALFYRVTVPFASPLDVPEDLTNRLIRSSSPTPLFRATRDAARRPSRSIYSARPGPDPIFPRYEIIPNTYNLDDGTGVSTICYLSQEAGIGPCTQQTAICVS